MTNNSSTSVSNSYADYCTDLVSTPDNSIVTCVTYASVLTSYSGWVTEDYAASKATAVPDIELSVPQAIFLAS